MSSKLRTAVSALLLASSAGVALAQPASADRSGAPNAARAPLANAAPVAAPSAPAARGRLSEAPVYRSAFEGYRALGDQAVLPWRESNDLVGRIGGWRSYAREVQEGALIGTGEPAGQGSTNTSPTATGLPAQRPEAARVDAPRSAPAAAAASAVTPAATPVDHSGHKKP